MPTATLARPRVAPVSTTAHERAHHHGEWLAAGVVLAFALPYLLTDLTTINKRALAGIGALALAVSLLFTALYHLGYADFRGEKLRKPLIGDVVWSAPTLATLSPIGAPLAHIGLHVGAVVHAYDTNTFLPPHSGGSR